MEKNYFFRVDLDGLIGALILALFFTILFRFFKKEREEHLVFSTQSFFLKRERHLKERFSSLPKWLLFGALIMALMALINPHFLVPKKGGEPQLNRGLAIFLLLDNSASMHYKVPTMLPTGGVGEVEKIDLSKKVAKQFVLGDKAAGLSGRKGDMIGLVSFSRIARVLSPLTLDHSKIIEELDRLEYNKDIKQVGTGIGYAIYKTVSTIQATLHFNQKGTPFYEIKNPILIIVTDGINEINPEDKNNHFRSMDVWTAAEYAKDNNVKVYIINIDPEFAKGPGKSYLELYDLMTRYTGGHFYTVGEAKDLLAIYKEIDKQEKSKVPLFAERNGENMPLVKDPLYPYFLGAALVMIFLAIVLEAFLFKRAI